MKGALTYSPRFTFVLLHLFQQFFRAVERLVSDRAIEPDIRRHLGTPSILSPFITRVYEVAQVPTDAFLAYLISWAVMPPVELIGRGRIIVIICRLLLRLNVVRVCLVREIKYNLQVSMSYMRSPNVRIFS